MGIEQAKIHFSIERDAFAKIEFKTDKLIDACDKTRIIGRGTEALVEK